MIFLLCDMFKIHKKGTDSSVPQATEKGLEPLLTESESAVLPITPFRIICRFIHQRTYIIILVSRQKSTYFFANLSLSKFILIYPADLS